MYRIRFFLIIFRCLLSPTRDLLETFSVSFWAIPFLDTDFSRLFTHSYSSYMALCRWNFVFHSKFRNVAIKKGWTPVTTAELIEYRRSIKALQKVRVETRLLYWNESRFYLEQTFIVKQNVHAICYVEGLIRGPKGILEPPEVFRSAGMRHRSPDLPEQIKQWISIRSVK